MPVSRLLNTILGILGMSAAYLAALCFLVCAVVVCLTAAAAISPPHPRSSDVLAPPAISEFDGSGSDPLLIPQSPYTETDLLGRRQAEMVQDPDYPRLR